MGASICGNKSLVMISLTAGCVLRSTPYGAKGVAPRRFSGTE
jgi:hypothetical protein